MKYAHRTALCLETENFPDAPNHPDFPSAVLRPGVTCSHTMVHRFLAESAWSTALDPLTHFGCSNGKLTASNVDVRFTA